MKRISSCVVALIAVVVIPQNLAAQAFPVAGGEVFRQEGIASWYGPQFEGRLTASGEVFNSSQFTAAHPTLPFGTFLIVTNRDNNRQVSVRVNDRGPFVEGRIIDVSQAAAEHLGMIVTGTAPVIIETIPAQARQQLPAQPEVFVRPQPETLVQPQVQQPPPAQPEVFVQPQPQAFTQPPVLVSTTTIPVEVPHNAPITINIFHSPHEPSQTSASPIPQTTAGTVVVPLEPRQTSGATVVPLAEPQMTAAVWPGPEPQWVPAPVAEIVPQATPVPNIVVMEEPVPVPQAAAGVAAVVLPVTPVIHEEPQPAQAAVTPPLPSPLAVSPPAVETRATPVILTNPDGTYRLQVGSFRVARNAVDTFVRLRDADFSPSYERNGEFFRVVLTGIRGTDVQSAVERLESMGYFGVVVTGE